MNNFKKFPYSFNVNKRKNSILLLFFKAIILLTICTNGCKDTITDPVPDPIPDPIPNPVLEGNYALCYTKSYNDRWEIFTTNFKGTGPQNISNHSYDDEYPQWSPDGRYIVYYSSGYEIFVYNVQTKTETNITPDEGGPSQNPKWTPNGKIIFNYPYAWSSFRGTYIINPDGSDKQQILDTIATNDIYFYPDSFTFLYVDASNKVHKTNIEHSFDEIVYELGNLDQYIIIGGFNPYTEELLIRPHINTIAAYNINTKNITVLLSTEPNYNFSSKLI